MKTKTQSQSKGKTALLRLRCTEVEKTKIAKRAERAGKSLSEYAREALLSAEVISRRPLSTNEAEAIRILQRVAQFFGNVSKLIKVKDPAWLTMTKNLTLISREAFALYFDPRRGITPRVYEVLNLPRHDSQV